jgi:ribosomal protein L32
MADTMTCPLCGQEHPVGTTYCPNAWADIPVPGPAPDCEAEEGGSCEPEQESEGINTDGAVDRLLVVCPDCGDEGLPGSVCRQCGQTLPQAGSRCARTVCLRMPDGVSVPVPCGQEILIGRDSEIAAIKRFLEPYKVVSHRHCYLTILPDGQSVIIRDPISTNGTWVGDNPDRIRPDEQRQARLPAQIRLGLRLHVTVGSDGDSNE